MQLNLTLSSTLTVYFGYANIQPKSVEMNSELFRLPHQYPAINSNPHITKQESR